jgi:hypothetical protein
VAGVLAATRVAPSGRPRPEPSTVERSDRSRSERSRSERLDELRAAGLIRPATRLERRLVTRSDEGVTQPRLDELRAAGLVRAATEPAGVGVDQVLPVAAPMRPLFPGGGLRRGGTVALTTPDLPRGALATGATSLLFALLAEASAAGSWCAVVGLPRLGLVAAGEAGLAIDRLAMVPNPGPEWAPVVAALLDGVDIVVTATPGQVSASMAGRLAARARQRGAVLLPMGAHWPGADLTLEVVRGAWHGLERGRGRLRRYEAEVLAYGRGAAARPRRAHLWLTGPGPATIDTPSIDTTFIDTTSIDQASIDVVPGLRLVS